jgi:hypothetical protein
MLDQILYPQLGVFVTPAGLTVRVMVMPGVFISFDVDNQTFDEAIIKRLTFKAQEQAKEQEAVNATQSV